MLAPAAPAAPAPSAPPTPTPAPTSSGTPAPTPTSGASAPAPSPAPAAPAPASPFAGMSAEEKDRLLSVYGRTIEAQRADLLATDQRFKDLEARVAAQAPPAPTDADKNKRFFDDPVPTTRALIKEEISAAIKPLLDFVGSVGPRTEYDRVKSELKSDPQYARIFEKAERHIDEAVSKMPGTPTRQSVAAAALAIYGAAAAGLLPELNFMPSPAPSPTSPVPGAAPMSVPAHLAPSAAPGPSGPSRPAETYEFSEAERRVMRETHMSEEEFLAGLRMSSRDVVNLDAWPKKGGK